MTLIPLKIPPGVVADGTDYAATGFWHSADKVRFRNNDPESIGGWIPFGDGTALLGTPRHAKAWRGLVSERFYAVGTSSKFYVFVEETKADVTPLRTTATLGANPFSFTIGLSTVTVTHTSHGATAGSYVTFSGATAAAGITVSGEYEILTVPTADTYTIQVSGTASSTTTGGGASVSAAYQINAGLADYVSGTGWGAGPWGRGGWGSGYDISSVGDQVRVWTSGNLGEDLLFCPRGGGIYLWDYGSPAARGTLINSLPGADEVPVKCNGIIVADQDRRVIGYGVNAYGSTDLDPMLIRWSTDGDYLKWDPTDTAETSTGRQLDDGREIICGIVGSREILIWTDTALYTMQYNYTRTVFNIERVGATDIAGPIAMANLGEATYWMGTNNFYMYNGRINTLPCTLQDYVFSDMNVSQSFKFFAIPNSLYNEVWFFYCSTDSVEIDRYVIMREDGVWTPGTMARTAGVDEGIVQSPRWCSPDGYIYQHEVGSNDGSTDPETPISSYIESGPIEIDGGNSHVLITKVIPDISFRKSTSAQPQATISFTIQNEPGSAGSAGDSVDIICTTPTTAPNAHTRRKGVRMRGRMARIRVSASQENTAWRLGTIRVDGTPMGKK